VRGSGDAQLAIPPGGGNTGAIVPGVRPVGALEIRDGALVHEIAVGALRDLARAASASSSFWSAGPGGTSLAPDAARADVLRALHVHLVQEGVLGTAHPAAAPSAGTRPGGAPLLAGSPSSLPIAHQIWEAAGAWAPQHREVLELVLRANLTPEELAAVLATDLTAATQLHRDVLAQLDELSGDLLLARRGGQDCPVLTVALTGWDGRLTPSARELLRGHIAGCGVCRRGRRLAGAYPRPVAADLPAFPQPVHPVNTTGTVIPAARAVVAAAGEVAASSAAGQVTPAPGVTPATGMTPASAALVAGVASPTAPPSVVRPQALTAPVVTAPVVATPAGTIAPGVAPDGPDPRARPLARPDPDAVAGPPSAPHRGPVRGYLAVAVAMLMAAVAVVMWKGIGWRGAPGVVTEPDPGVSSGLMTGDAARSSGPLPSGAQVADGRVAAPAPSTTGSAAGAGTGPSGSVSASATTGVGRLRVSSSVVDLGPAAGSARLTLTNTGHAAVAWTAAISGGGLSVSARSGTVPAGKDAVVSVSVNRAALPDGAFSGTLTVNVATGQTLKVPVRGTNARPPVLSKLAQTGDTTSALSSTCHVIPTAGAAAIIRVTATDADGIAGVTAVYMSSAKSADGSAVATASAALTAGAGGVYTGRIGAFTAAGTYSITVTATDKAGHSTSAALNVVIPGCSNQVLGFSEVSAG